MTPSENPTILALEVASAKANRKVNTAEAVVAIDDTHVIDHLRVGCYYFQ